MTAGPPALSILLVDDHADSLEPLARLLRHHGHNVRTAATLKDGLAAALECHPDLLVSDLSLPDGDGCDLLDRVRAAAPTVRGLAVTGLTGTTFEQMLERCVRAGFEKFLVKPLLSKDFLSALRELFPTFQARAAGAAPGLDSGAA
jgi:two-component system OmpR family response regulator